MGIIFLLASHLQGLITFIFILKRRRFNPTVRPICSCPRHMINESVIEDKTPQSTIDIRVCYIDMNRLIGYQLTADLFCCLQEHANGLAQAPKH